MERKVDDDEIILHVLGEIASIFPRKIIRRVIASQSKIK